jgi:hypothetical protein
MMKRATPFAGARSRAMPLIFDRCEEASIASGLLRMGFDAHR